MSERAKLINIESDFEFAIGEAKKNISFRWNIHLPN
jgi:hypothetical protein